MVRERRAQRRRAVGAKREGDGRTPSGTYGFDFMFGVNPIRACTSRSARVTGTNIVWDDDPDSAEPQPLDRHEHGVGGRRSRADVQRAVVLYGAVIAYNTARTPGLGSAIFLHVSHGSSTAGCVAVPTDQLLVAAPLARPGPLGLIAIGDARLPVRCRYFRSGDDDFLTPAARILTAR